MLASEFFSAWYLGRNPAHEIIFASYAQDRSDDVGKAVRDLMASEMHENVFPNGKLRADAKGTRKFQTLEDGTFFTTSWKGATTGRGANCTTKDTIIETEIGPLPIEEIYHMESMPRVLSFDFKKQQVCFSKIKCCRKITNVPVYRFETVNGRSLKCTADHRVYSRNKGFIEVKDLNLGDMLLCVSNEKTVIDPVSIPPILHNAHDTVYDFQIEKIHNYFTAGILSHNCLILDDLIKDREDAQSDTNRRKREEWFSSSGYTRLMADEGSDEGRILLIMTRWSYDDIAAHLLKQLAHEKWVVLNCPAIAEDKDILGRKEGEALWPDRYSTNRLEKVKKSLLPEDWTALYQQRPLPKEGGIWKLYYFKEYNVYYLQRIEDLCKRDEDLPEELKWFHRIIISLDTAYKTSQMNDPSVLTVWGYSKNRQYLLEVARKKLEYPQLKKWIQKYHRKYLEWNMGPVPILIEDAASGQSLIQDFKTPEFALPVIAIKPVKSKVVRAEHAAGYAETGSLFLPENATWMADFKQEFAQFPYGAHDDQVDSTSQYINWFYKPKRRRRRGKVYAK